MGLDLPPGPSWKPTSAMGFNIKKKAIKGHMPGHVQGSKWKVPGRKCKLCVWVQQLPDICLAKFGCQNRSQTVLQILSPVIAATPASGRVHAGRACLLLPCAGRRPCCYCLHLQYLREWATQIIRSRIIFLANRGVDKKNVDCCIGTVNTACSSWEAFIEKFLSPV